MQKQSHECCKTKAEAEHRSTNRLDAFSISLAPVLRDKDYWACCHAHQGSINKIGDAVWLGYSRKVKALCIKPSYHEVVDHDNQQAHQRLISWRQRKPENVPVKTFLNHISTCLFTFLSRISVHMGCVNSSALFNQSEINPLIFNFTNFIIKNCPKISSDSYFESHNIISTVPNILPVPDCVLP